MTQREETITHFTFTFNKEMYQTTWHADINTDDILLLAGGKYHANALFTQLFSQ